VEAAAKKVRRAKRHGQRGTIKHQTGRLVWSMA